MPALPAFGVSVAHFRDVQKTFRFLLRMKGKSLIVKLLMPVFLRILPSRTLKSETQRKTHSRWMSNEAHGPNALQGHVKSKNTVSFAAPAVEKRQ